MSVGAKHLEDKLSVIAKNSSPNTSPVQLSVVRCQWEKEFSHCLPCSQLFCLFQFRFHPF
ncbi:MULTISPECIES: hypothetical protein [Nostocales]|uniref:hypothetical protein n=1 Tax=Nostocales TaxID=1161 RepID=UPI001391AE0E|nr:MULTISPECIES: hypothetical protein [Nostocales]